MPERLSYLKILLYLCVLSLVLGQYSVVVGLTGGKVYLFDLLIFIFSVYGLVYYLGIERGFRIPKYLNLYFVFSSVAFLSLLYRVFDFSLEATLISSFYLVRYVVYLFAGVVIYNMLIGREISSNSFLTLIFTSSFVLSVAGFIQLIVLPDLGMLDPSLGWDPHKNRLASTFFDPNFSGGYLALSLTVALGLMLSGSYTFSKIKLAAFVAAPLLALFLTFSRSSWGMMAVSVFMFGVLKYRKLLLIGLVTAFLVYFAVPRVQTRLAGITDPADSASLRLVSWKNTLTIAKDNLFTGVGFNTFRYAQKEYGFFEAGSLGGHGGSGSDSSFLFVLATTGILGFIVFLTAYFLPAISEFAGKRKSFLSMVIISLAFGMFVQSQFINLLFYPQILFIYSGLLSLTNYTRS